ncbi:hypothetical protein IPL85_01320 [Candidatus Saccharibacteria bacterium]|nr:MAG: hypothetical protein IPL85_01320 [Candidatus Saccharibacteria bacterium]
MKRLKKLLLLVCVSLLIAAGIGGGINTLESVPAEKGFVFGPPIAQQKMETDGTFKVQRWGYPGTYREIQTFLGSGENPYEVSYTSRAFNPMLLLANIIFLMSFVAAVLAPITIFWRPKKKTAEVKTTEKKAESQVKTNHADTRD